jgi:hypothetical protein
MKTLIFAGLLFLTFTVLNAQVTLEKKYDYSTSVVELENAGFKYYLMDVPNGQCRLYNIDHSLFKTINCNIPSGYFLYDIKFISESVFDTDPGIELLCTFFKYYQNAAYYEYDSKIINDDGSQIAFIDGSLYNYINQTDDNSWKLFSYCYDFSIFPEKVWTNIYNLPGSPTTMAFMNPQNPEVLLNAFPNPATNSLKVAYSLPENVSQAKLHLIDNSGKHAGQFIVDNHTDHLMLNVDRFKTGIYFYFIEYGNTRTASKKLVIR